MCSVAVTCAAVGRWRLWGNFFFYYSVVRPFSELIQGYIVRILAGKFFVLEDISVCSNAAPQMKGNEHHMFLYLLGIMRVLVWTMFYRRSFMEMGCFINCVP